MRPVLQLGGVPVYQLGGAVVYVAGLAIDADGAPHAYHPESGRGLDRLGNAGRPGRWWGLACDDAGVPYVQTDADPAPGFYISPTALADRTRALRDPRRYVDSSSIAYLAIPPELRRAGVRLGDVAVVYYRPTARLETAIVADIGPRGKLGEGSIALAQRLGIDGSPRTGGAPHGVVTAIFAGSAASPAWPRAAADIDAEARALLAAWGGQRRIIGAAL